MKEIKDYLHLYLGCECMMVINSYHAVHELKLSKDTPFRLRGSHVDYFTDKATKAHIKPILRPLSDMTEEEIKEVAWLLHRFKPEDVRGKDSVGNIKVTNKSPFYYWINVRQHLNAETCIYLLKRGFDLFELIESGLAISKTQTQEQ